MLANFAEREWIKVSLVFENLFFAHKKISLMHWFIKNEGTPVITLATHVHFFPRDFFTVKMWPVNTFRVFMFYCRNFCVNDTSQFWVGSVRRWWLLFGAENCGRKSELWSFSLFKSQRFTNPRYTNSNWECNALKSCNSLSVIRCKVVFFAILSY